ncbi:disulfide bond formation protein DsbB [Candidatus Symbiobacter mobilis CR]|uniref:Disulfide bond formation protein B n=1 Tax=Candidatus Symbiobacter mobilis CR TaxID=946483 RepID=U5N8I1_9BURK|nr:disulfide bond formation protein DsbB [Candidatus Symbiobacter mobilis CR]
MFDFARAIYLYRRFLAWFSGRAVFAFVGIACVMMVSYGVYLQHQTGVEPCPMCIVQRYALLALALVAGLAALVRRRVVHGVCATLLLMFALFGAVVAARQSWIQWYPPLEGSCGRDWYSQITNLPLGKALPMFFDATGDCSSSDWVFLGGTIANWTFLCFSLFAVLSIRELFALRQSVPAASPASPSCPSP